MINKNQKGHQLTTSDYPREILILQYIVTYIFHSTNNFNKIQSLLISKNYSYSYLITMKIKKSYIVIKIVIHLNTKRQSSVSSCYPSNTSKSEVH